MSTDTKINRRGAEAQRRERPILFSGAMVRAILEGRKTKTRRVVKPQPVMLAGPNFDGLWSDTVDPVVRYFGSPYGQLGDRLWVRETWATSHRWDSTSPSRLPSDGAAAIYFREGDDTPANTSRDGGVIQRWQPSIFMPRWASRIMLEVTVVRVERLQEISSADAMAEGAEKEDTFNYSLDERARMGLRDGSQWGYWNGFKMLWDSINAKRGFGWDVNPWVWVVEFRVLPSSDAGTAPLQAKGAEARTSGSQLSTLHPQSSHPFL